MAERDECYTETLMRNMGDTPPPVDPPEVEVPPLMVIADADLRLDYVSNLRDALDAYVADLAARRRRNVVIGGGVTVCQLIDGRWEPILPLCPKCGAKIESQGG